MRRSRWVVTSVIAGTLAAGCGSSGGSTAARPSSSRPSSGGQTSSSASSPGGVQVDLTIEGNSNATIKGTKGTCQLSKTIGNSYEFNGVDYPELGPNGAFSLAVGTHIGDRVAPPNIKLVIKDAGYLSGADVSGIQVNPEATVVNLDQGVSGSTAGGPMQSVRITGTIHCT